MFAFPVNAVFITLFCTGFVLVAFIVESTVICSRLLSFVLSSADKNPGVVVDAFVCV